MNLKYKTFKFFYLKNYLTKWIHTFSVKIGSPRGIGRPPKHANRPTSPAKSPIAKHKNAQKRGKSPKRASKSPTKGGHEDRPIYIMDLPAVEHKYKCPECSFDSYKRPHFVYHAKSAHSRDYEIFYRCIGCQKRFEQMRECMLHVSACNRVQKAADVQADKGRNFRAKI